MIHFSCNQNGFINAIKRAGEGLHQKIFVVYIVSRQMRAIRITNSVYVWTFVVIIATRFISKLRVIYCSCMDHYMLSQQHRQYLFEGIKINLLFLFVSLKQECYRVVLILSLMLGHLIGVDQMKEFQCDNVCYVYAKRSWFNAINTQFDSESHKYTHNMRFNFNITHIQKVFHSLARISVNWNKIIFGVCAPIQLNY